MDKTEYYKKKYKSEKKRKLIKKNWYLRKSLKKFNIEKSLYTLIVLTILDLKWEDVKSKCRKRELTEARFILMTHFKENGLNLNEIGAQFSFRDHTTVIHSLNSFKDLYETDKKFKKTVDFINYEYDRAKFGISDFKNEISTSVEQEQREGEKSRYLFV